MSFAAILTQNEVLTDQMEKLSNAGGDVHGVFGLRRQDSGQAGDRPQEDTRLGLEREPAGRYPGSQAGNRSGDLSEEIGGGNGSDGAEFR